MRVNIKRLVREINLSKNPLMPIFEAVVNSIHAIFARAKTDSFNGVIKIIIEREQNETLNLDSKLNYRNNVLNIIIEDNGMGFTSENFNSFNTSFTDLKKDEYGGKGMGRFSWLKAFKQIKIESNYREDKKFYKRSFEFNENGDGIHRRKKSPSSLSEHKTTISLYNLENLWQDHYKKTNSDIAHQIIEHILEYLVIFSTCPTILLVDPVTNIEVNLNQIYLSEIVSKSKTFKTILNGNELLVRIFKIIGNRDDHNIYYVADRRSVKTDKIEALIPDFASVKHWDEDGYFNYAVYVSHVTLNYYVNKDRTDFKDNEFESNLHLDMNAIKRETAIILSNYFKEILEPIKEERIKIINNFIDKNPKYNSLKLEPEKLENININKDIDLQLHAISIDEENKLFDELEKISKDGFADYQKSDSFKKLLEKIEVYKRDQLAQYVLLRKEIIGLLENALKIDQETKNYDEEKVVHDLIFPRYKSNKDLNYDEHNLWIIDDRLANYEYIKSESVSKTGAKQTTRQDILLYNKVISYKEGSSKLKPNSVMMIEFKRPGRDDYEHFDNPITQMRGYVSKMTSQKEIIQDGRPVYIDMNTPFYCYIICDVLTKFKEILTYTYRDFKQTPDGIGYFNIIDCVYIELIPYSKLIDDAFARNKIFFEKLGILNNGR